MTREELAARGWLDRDPPLDILLVSGDAYVDHPAFGAAVIGRVLEARGYRVGLIAQPVWDRPDDVMRLGRPRLFAGVTAGNLDSMLNKFTAQRKVRSDDAYSPGGRADQRPKRATIVYANLLRQAFPGLSIILGGIEASLRRLAHYDYWSDTVRRSILLDAKADLLIFGMGEHAVSEVAERMSSGERVDDIRDLQGSAFALGKGHWESMETSQDLGDKRPVLLPSYEAVREDVAAFSEMSRLFAREANPGNACPLIQPHGERAVFCNPPGEPLDTAALDAVYDLPFTRRPHWTYGQETIPALETVKHSIVTTRGCFGGCTFCSIAAHEGRQVQSRSAASVLREVRALSARDDFHGTLTDVGGPTANMYRMGCESRRIERACRRRSCVYPKICTHLKTDHGPLLKLLRAIRKEPGLRHVFIASGIRMDLAERSPEFIAEVAA
ncbi:MAG: YgiQ family radical SAM protein, partial [Deltaproteobacteria bacterium]|nr:YgiQ family radical SAM protein [Deltaproteobacteria bacterium]